MEARRDEYDSITEEKPLERCFEERAVQRREGRGVIVSTQAQGTAPAKAQRYETAQST